MLLLKCSCFVAGFELTFFSGVYGTTVGHNLHFGNEAKALIGLCGIFIGAGEILGEYACLWYHLRNVKNTQRIRISNVSILQIFNCSKVCSLKCY